jgi:hypothetical protein
VWASLLASGNTFRCDTHIQCSMATASCCDLNSADHLLWPTWQHARGTAASLSVTKGCSSCGDGWCLLSTVLQEFWPRLTNLKWLHSCSAGLEHLLFPELVNSSVTLTNAKGVYSHSLAE